MNFCLAVEVDLAVRVGLVGWEAEVFVMMKKSWFLLTDGKEMVETRRR